MSAISLNKITQTHAFKRVAFQAWSRYYYASNTQTWLQIAKHPLALTVAVCGLRYGMGDGIAQKMSTVGGYDIRRGLTFGLFGLFTGYHCFFMYSKVYPYLMRRFQLKPITCVVIENCFTAPVIYYTAFYFTQNFVDTRQFSLQTAWSNASANRFEDVKNLWLFWGPMHLVSFYFVPAPLRGAFAAMVGTAWAFILSTMRELPAVTRQLHELHGARHPAMQDDAAAVSQAVEAPEPIASVSFPTSLAAPLKDALLSQTNLGRMGRINQT